MIFDHVAEVAVHDANQVQLWHVLFHVDNSGWMNSDVAFLEKLF